MLFYHPSTTALFPAAIEIMVQTAQASIYDLLCCLHTLCFLSHYDTMYYHNVMLYQSVLFLQLYTLEVKMKSLARIKVWSKT